MPDPVNPPRRRFIGASMLTVAGAELALAGYAKAAQDVTGLGGAPAGVSAGFGPLRQVKAGPLDIGYADLGPSEGPVVMLLHGWPYDIHSYVDVAPWLASRGYRVIAPYLRGYGTTRFLSNTTMRSGQQAATATDIIALMDALRIPKAIVAGYDWGARTADVMAALWPERCTALVSVSGYLIINVSANQQPLPPQAELGWWYQYYFATERGRLGYDRNRRDFARLIWKLSSPKWDFDDATFERSAAAMDNPDHVAVVIHNYRWRLGLAEGDPLFDALERRLQAAPLIAVPTITIGSDFDGANADGEAYAKQFSGRHAHRVFRDIGHNVPQEAPQAFAQAVIDAGA